MAGCSRSGGADAAGTGLSVGGVGFIAVHSDGAVSAADGMEPEALRVAEGTGAGVLECEEGVGEGAPAAPLPGLPPLRGRGDVQLRLLYQGCGWPGVFTRSVYTDVLAVR